MRALVRILVLLLLVGCGGRDDATAPGTSEGPEVLDPIPEGMMLPGSPDERAIGALVTLAPTPVPSSQIQGTLLTPRLRTLISPDATVQEVNEVLAAQSAAIVSMTRGVPIVVLVIDPVADLAEAEARAAELAATPAFLAAFPARSFEAAPAGGRNSRPADLPDGADEEGPDEYLTHLRMPAAWNARALDDADVTVIVADHFPDRNVHPGIDPLAFSFYGGFGTDAYGRNGTIAGNEGIHSAGIIGGNWDTNLPGIHPGSGLRIVGIPVSGLDLWEVSGAIDDELRYGLNQGRDRTVLLTGLTYAEADAEGLTALEMASLALGWRSIVRAQGRDFEPELLHIVPGGDQSLLDEAPPLGTDTSYWSVAARYGDLRDYLLSLDPFEEEIEAFDAIIADTGPLSRLPLDNVLVVGASTSDGNPLPTGAQLTDVRTHGEYVFGPCVLPETTAPGSRCDGEMAGYTGTFAAAPQVAGLGAYLWSLSPTQNSLELAAMIQRSFRDGFVDGYQAVLELDPNLLDPRVRETILDPNDDGRFDEADVQTFLGAFTTFETARQEGSAEPDYSRYDLNGDGFTGGTSAASVDLDADRARGTVSAEGLDSAFNESALTDLEILCYYAHSDLYFGNPDDLDELLPGCLDQLRIEARGLENGVSEDGQYLRITVTGPDGGEVEGARVTVSVAGGTADPSSAETDDEGYVRTTIRPAAGSDRVFVTIEAEDNEGRRGSETVIAVNLDTLPIRVVQGGRAWLIAFSSDPDNVDYNLYTDSGTNEPTSWSVNWEYEIDGEQNGSTCTGLAGVRAESELLFDPETQLFRGAEFSATIEASGTQSTADPGSSVYCRGEGQIQLTYGIRINEGTWIFTTEGNIDVDGDADAGWNVILTYRDLDGQSRAWPELTDLDGEFRLGPGEYYLRLNPRAFGTTNLLENRGFVGACAMNFQIVAVQES